MAVQVIPNDVQILGHLSAQSATAPPGSVDDQAVKSGANIDPAKLGHYHRPGIAQPNTAAADETRFLFRARAAGTVLEFTAGSLVKAVGDATCTFMLKKTTGGVTTDLLTGVITLNSSSTNRVAQAGTLTGGVNLVAGDVLEVVIDATIGTGTLPTGVFCDCLVKEAAV